MIEFENTSVNRETSEGYIAIVKKSVFFYGPTCRCGRCALTFLTAHLDSLACPNERCELQKWESVIDGRSVDTPLPSLLAHLPSYTVKSLDMMRQQNRTTEWLGKKIVRLARVNEKYL